MREIDDDGDDVNDGSGDPMRAAGGRETENTPAEIELSDETMRALVPEAYKLKQWSSAGELKWLPRLKGSDQEVHESSRRRDINIS